MRHLTIINLIIFIFLLGTVLPSFSAVKATIEYKVPIQYCKINESEVELKAKDFFYNSQKVKDGVIDENITNALISYGVLQHVNPEKAEYSLKLGILYDKINKDYEARINLFRAMGLEKSNPEVYFYLGEFDYKREYYRRALKYYNEAYKLGLDKNYDLLYKMGDIYEKFGDTHSALKFLTEAQKQNPNTDLDNKIKRIQILDGTNQAYYSNTRIRG